MSYGKRAIPRIPNDLRSCRDWVDRPYHDTGYAKLSDRAIGSSVQSFPDHGHDTTAGHKKSW